MARCLILRPALLGLIVLAAANPAVAQTRPNIRAGAPAKPAAAPPAQATAAATPDPRMDPILNEWYQSSKQITKLQGEHMRFNYDFVFGVMKRAEGEFYYEAPDKGRIDLKGSTVKGGAVVNKAGPNGKQTTFTVQSDVPQRWVCDGTQILEIDDVAKTVTQYEIPKEARGEHIMDGPLPFLFGMPPEKAKQRYHMQLMATTADDYIIQVVPRWHQDAANYKYAEVILERKTMLPKAVRMIDPPETQETVYTFPKIEKNPKKSLLSFLRGSSDPFKPDLKNYTFNAAPPPEVVNADKPSVPSVIGLSHKDAQKMLEARGYVVKLYKGDPATGPQFVHRVYKQTPEPRTLLERGETVKLVLYIEPPVSQVKAEQGPTPKQGGMPDVTGLDWKEAEKLLRSRGYTVSFRRGQIADRPADVFRVQAQSPKAGAAIAPGDTVTLTLLIAPEKPQTEE